MANKDAPQEATYSRTELREKSLQLFGVQPEVFDGALHGNAKQEFTVAEVKGLIRGFLERKVK